MVCASMFWISVGSPLAGSIENTATLFSPPLNTFLPPISSVPELRLVMVDEAAVRMDVDGAGHLRVAVRWRGRRASS